MVAKAKGKAPPSARRKLRTALVKKLRQKEQAARGNRIAAAGRVVTQQAQEVPIHLRAGSPLVKTKVHPKDWITKAGKRVEVDLGRVPWLPDDWGQGVKTTNPIARSRPGRGGTYVVWVSPEGRVFYHKPSVEAFMGLKEGSLGHKDGFKGQLRLAQLQGKHTDEASFFAILSPKERKLLQPASKFHFSVISARRATSDKGMADIAVLQAHFERAGISPTWYVDRPSLAAYRRLGLNAVVGGGLTEARNRALDDARKQGKACVQLSDDIARWEYHDGEQAEGRTDADCNAAHARATCHVVSPVAAARFILAKMRGSPERPRLGGVFPLGSCSRSFHSGPFSGHHFILGDFFVADDSPVRFDREMTLKEDYDFTCAHIARHGSVMRCNRMTVAAKHYSNAGGACSNRDKKGREERRNINILFRKWPGAFREHPKRKNEVMLQWSEAGLKRARETEGPEEGAKRAGGNTLQREALALWKKKKAVKWGGLERPKNWPETTLPDPLAEAPWLPPGWRAAVKVSISGRVQRCYINKEGRVKYHQSQFGLASKRKGGAWAIVQRKAAGAGGSVRKRPAKAA